MKTAVFRILMASAAVLSAALASGCLTDGWTSAAMEDTRRFKTQEMDRLPLLRDEVKTYRENQEPNWIRPNPPY